MLAQSGHASCCATSADCSSWIITQQGLADIELVTVLRNPSPCLQHDGPPTMNSSTTYQVLDWMLMNGWHFEVVNSERMIKRVAPYYLDSDKNFYMVQRRKEISHSYLLALATAATIIAAGNVDCVRHGGALMNEVSLDECSFCCSDTHQCCCQSITPRNRAVMNAVDVAVIPINAVVNQSPPGTEQYYKHLLEHHREPPGKQAVALQLGFRDEDCVLPPSEAARKRRRTHRKDQSKGDLNVDEVVMEPFQFD
eukprot:3983091-Lingulodinium_polyedra.AAC.1